MVTVTNICHQCNLCIRLMTHKLRGHVTSRYQIDRLNDDRNNEILEQTYTHIETRRSLEDDDIDYGIQVHATTAFRKSLLPYLGVPWTCRRGAIPR